MNIEQAINLIKDNSDNEEVKKLFDSNADKRVNQAIKTYQEKTEAEKITALQLQIESLQKENTTKSLKQIALSMGLDESLTHLAIGNSEEETRRNTEVLLKGINFASEQRANEEVNKRMSGRMPESGSSPGVVDIKTLTAEEIAKLSDKDYNNALSNLTN